MGMDIILFQILFLETWATFKVVTMSSQTTLWEAWEISSNNNKISSNKVSKMLAQSLDSSNKESVFSKESKVMLHKAAKIKPNWETSKVVTMSSQTMLWEAWEI